MQTRQNSETNNEYFGNTTDEQIAVNNWLTKWDSWIRSQVVDNPDDSYWIVTGVVLSILDGVLDGFNAISSTVPEYQMTNLLD